MSNDSKESKLSQIVRKGTLYVMSNNQEFFYLEQLCKKNKIPFDYGKKEKGVVNYCLDLYLDELKETKDKTRSKYYAIFKTAKTILRS